MPCHFRVIFRDRDFPIHYRDYQQYLSVYWQNSFPNLWVRSQFLQLWLQTRISPFKSELKCLLPPQFRWQLWQTRFNHFPNVNMKPCREKWILSFFSRDKRGSTAPGGWGWGLAGRTAETCMFSYFSLSHTHTLSSPHPFFLKTTQEEINHEGKTQLHPLAAGHSSYFVWNWLSESRRPARGAGTWYERNLRMKLRGLISSLHIPHSVSTVQLQSNTPLSWIDKRNWIPS